MRKIWTILLTMIFIASGASRLFSQPETKVVESTPASIVSDAVVRSTAEAVVDWPKVLQGMGVEPEKNLPGEDFNLMIKKLKTLPGIVMKVRESAGRIVLLQEWITILKGMGIEPKGGMSDKEWITVLSKAGLDMEGQPQSAQDTSPAVSGQEAEDSSEAVPEAKRSGARALVQIPLQSQVAPSTGPKMMTLELRGMDVLEVLKIFSRQSGMNIVTSPNVRGNITIFLKDVELWEALRLVLETNDLAYVLDGNVVRVMTSADYERFYGSRFDDKAVTDILNLKYVKALPMSRFLDSSRSRLGRIIVYELNNSLILIDAPESIAKMKKLAQSLDQEQETKVFNINYAKVEDILSKLTSIATKEVGEIQMDKRTSKILVTDFSDKIRQMERIVDAFDARHKTVLIEAKIVQVTLSDKYQMGVNWEHVFTKVNEKNIPGNVKGNFNILPIGGIGLTATLGMLTLNNYTALIQMLETAGKTNLLSSPRITALNNESAKILVGTKEPYVTTTVTTPGGGGPVITAEQITFVDVGVKLYVTPVIGEDGYITLKIKPEVSAVDRTITTSQGNSIPILRTSEADTSVVVKDGETVMIAGLIEDKYEKSNSGVPLLSKIPILGFPFRSHTSTKVKTEIIVFITPKIIGS